MSVALYAQRLAGCGVKVFEIRPASSSTDMIAKVEKIYDEKIANGLLPATPYGGRQRHRRSAPSPTACWTYPPARSST